MPNRAEQLGYMQQFPVKTDAASWRQEDVTIGANELKTVTFNDTAPNMFFIQNTTDVALWVGITKIPTTESYERKIDANTCGTFGRPVPTRTLHILNNANKAVTITLFSVYDKFDITVLKDFSFTGTIGSIVNDGIIKGFSGGVSLPYGTNHIGTVGLDPLPTGNNNIGNVGFSPAALTQLNAIITEIKESNKAVKDILFFERTAETEDVTIDFAQQDFVPNYLHFIANDDDADAIAVTLTFTNGNEKMFTLVKGDVFGDLKMGIKKIKIEPKTPGASVSWRVMVGNRG